MKCSHDILKPKYRKHIFIIVTLTAILFTLAACNMQANQQQAPNAQENVQDYTQSQLVQLNPGTGNITSQTALPLGLYSSTSDAGGCSLTLDGSNTCSLTYVDDNGNTKFCYGPATITDGKIVINDNITGRQVVCNYRMEGNTCKLDVDGKSFALQKR